MKTLPPVQKSVLFRTGGFFFKLTFFYVQKTSKNIYERSLVFMYFCERFLVEL